MPTEWLLLLKYFQSKKWISARKSRKKVGISFRQFCLCIFSHCVHNYKLMQLFLRHFDWQTSPVYHIREEVMQSAPWSLAKFLFLCTCPRLLPFLSSSVINGEFQHSARSSMLSALWFTKQGCSTGMGRLKWLFTSAAAWSPIFLCTLGGSHGSRESWGNRKIRGKANFSDSFPHVQSIGLFCIQF